MKEAKTIQFDLTPRDVWVPLSNECAVYCNENGGMTKVAALRAGRHALSDEQIRKLFVERRVVRENVEITFGTWEPVEGGEDGECEATAIFRAPSAAEKGA